MLLVRGIDLKKSFKDFCDVVIKGETLLIARPGNENVVMISEAKLREYEKAKRNEEYLQKLNASLSQFSSGKTKTIDLIED